MAVPLDASSFNTTVVSTSSTPSLPSNATATPSNTNATVSQSTGTTASITSSPVPPDSSTALPPTGSSSVVSSTSPPSVSKSSSKSSVAPRVIEGAASSSSAPSTTAVTTTPVTSPPTSSSSAASSNNNDDSNSISKTQPNGSDPSPPSPPPAPTSSDPSPPPAPTRSSTSAAPSSRTTPPALPPTSPSKPSATSRSQTNQAPAVSSAPVSSVPVGDVQSTPARVDSEIPDSTPVSSSAPASAAADASPVSSVTALNVSNISSPALAVSASPSTTGSSTLAALQNTPPTTTAADSQGKGSAATPQFVTHLSTMTSDGQVYTLTSVGLGPSSVQDSAIQSSGFFSNRGAVAGVFLVVTLAVLSLIGCCVFAIRRRRQRVESDIREPTLPPLGASPFDDEYDSHYRRGSQMRALSDLLSTGASAPGAGHLQIRSRSPPTSEDSHAFSRESYHSTEPINGRGVTNPFSNHHSVLPPADEHEEIAPPPLPMTTTNPFATSSYSVHSIVESSPSIYPPTLPVTGDDDDYWHRQGIAPTPEPRHTSNFTEEQAARQQPTPPESALGLWTNVSQSTITPPNRSENELVRDLHPRMEPTSVHKGSTAPISVPPGLEIRERRYFLDGSWTIPNRDEFAPG